MYAYSIETFIELERPRSGIELELHGAESGQCRRDIVSDVDVELGIPHELETIRHLSPCSWALADEDLLGYVCM